MAGLEMVTATTTAFGLLNSALDGLLKLAAISDKVAEQLGVEGDLDFIRDEFAMMQAFLKAADARARSGKVIDTWVRQLRVLANDVEDCLEESTLHLEQQPAPGAAAAAAFCRHLPRTLKERHRIVKEIRRLKTKVQYVSQRRKRYWFSHEQAQCIAAAADEDDDDAGWGSFMTGRRRQQGDKLPAKKARLTRLICSGDRSLRVISVWGGDHGRRGKASASVVREAYEDPETRREFRYRAWLKVAHPFDPHAFMKAMLWKFYSNSADDIQESAAIAGIEATNKVAAAAAEQPLIVEEFARQVNGNRFLVVLDDLSDAEVWDCIKAFLPDRNNGSRVVVCTKHKGIAMLSPEQPIQVAESEVDDDLLDGHPPIHLFFSKGLEIGWVQPNSEISGESSKSITKPMDEGQANSGGQSRKQQQVDRRESMVATLEDNQLVGRDSDISEVIKLISPDDQGREIRYISVSGEAGVGKTALVRSLCQREELSGKFERTVWVSVPHPFNLEELTRTLKQQLDPKKEPDAFGASTKKVNEKPKAKGSESSKRNLIVLDDVSSSNELDEIKSAMKGYSGSRVIITTRDPNAARLHDDNKSYQLGRLNYEDALKLFKKKIKGYLHGDNLPEQAENIVKKCDGLPLVIINVARSLQEKPTKKWREFFDHMSAELESYPKLEDVNRMLMRSYTSMPPELKSCFVYLSVFPQDSIIRRRCLVRRWIAEGYASEGHGMSAEEVADKKFQYLISRNMIQPSGTTMSKIGNRGETYYFEIQKLIQSVSRRISAEENHVIVLDEDEQSLQYKSKTRHLTVMSGWSREDRKSNALESVVDLSHLRSLTVSGEFKSFFISRKMRMLRVLDLEETYGLRDRDLSSIGKLYHLRYLSLRGSEGVFHLPDSVGYLSNLETLDVRGTMVTKLPSTIVKLQKLKYLRAGIIACDEDDSYTAVLDSLPQYCFKAFEVFFSKEPSYEGVEELDLKILAPLICLMVNVWLRGFDVRGVKVPRRIGKLRALQTLGVVNVARGKNVLSEIKKLTQLRKLGITGIKKNHCKDLGSVIFSCSHLQTLSMRAEGKNGLVGCLDDMPPPQDLQSLKLYGNLGRLPRWIGELQTLAKLTLRSTLLEQDDVQVLGELRNLASLRLLGRSFKSEELHFRGNTFASLVALEIDGLSNTKTVKFEEPTMATLKLLKVNCWWDTITEFCWFTGIRHLPNLMEVLLNGLDCGKSEKYFQESDPKVEMSKEFKEWLAESQQLWVKNRELKDHLLAQLEGNENSPRLNMEY